MRLLWSMLLGLCVASGAIPGSLAQDFPSQPMRIIVPYPPGGVTDLVGRVVAEGLREKLKVQVVVENKPGGNGIIGSGEFLRARNDGHTLLIGGFGSHIIPPLVNPKYPYDAAKDFLPLAQMAEFVNVMVVSKDLPVKTVQEFIALAKAKPGALNFGTTGVGASNHLTAEMFMQQTGVKMVHVPYKGGTAALQDLAGGQVQVIFENLPPSLGLIQSGAVKVLAVTSDYRVDQLPDVPTMVDSGLPNFKVTSWICVFGSAGLSDANRDKLSRTLGEIGRDPATRERFKKIGFEPNVKEAAELKAFFAAETEKWRKVVDAAGIKVEP
jgi:tripartite-type tricarboxylate transporter receptor subunit TctC